MWLEEAGSFHCFDGTAGSRPTMAFASDREGNWEVYLMQADGTRLLRTADNRVWKTPSACFVGSGKTVFRSHRDGNLEIYVAIVEGSNPQRPAGRPYPEIKASWGGGALAISRPLCQGGSASRIWARTSSGSHTPISTVGTSVSALYTISLSPYAPAGRLDGMGKRTSVSTASPAGQLLVC